MATDGLWLVDEEELEEFERQFFNSDILTALELKKHILRLNNIDDFIVYVRGREVSEYDVMPLSGFIEARAREVSIPYMGKVDIDITVRPHRAGGRVEE